MDETIVKMIIHTRNLFVLYFGTSTLQKKDFSNQNSGHLGSRYIFIDYTIDLFCVSCFFWVFKA